MSSCRCFALQATTDLYGKCTTRHSGTSAAAPEAAGVFALALEAKSVSLYAKFDGDRFSRVATRYDRIVECES